MYTLIYRYVNVSIYIYIYIYILYIIEKHIIQNHSSQRCPQVPTFSLHVLILAPHVPTFSSQTSLKICLGARPLSQGPSQHASQRTSQRNVFAADIPFVPTSRPNIRTNVRPKVSQGVPRSRPNVRPKVSQGSRPKVIWGRQAIHFQ